MSMQKLYEMNGAPCKCGKEHTFSARVISGSGVISQLPAILKEYNVKKAYVISDINTWKAAGEQVCALLSENSFKYTSHCFQQDMIEPDEHSVGSAIMHYEHDCDLVIGVGSGVINDIGKIVSAMADKPYIIVGTAPSMDGYASATSSMTRDNLKISLNSKSAEVVIGDTDILCQAPLKMLKAGLGDMIAKYVSICEWRIAHLITGEYYCEEVAALIRSALKGCIDQAEGLMQRDPAAVSAVFEGLVIGGVAMKYAGLSRPASGVEHYISHVLDMRGVEFGTPIELHGLQCVAGTMIAVKLYEKIKGITPDKEKALAYAEQFDYDVWAKEMQDFLGKGAESMIALEKKEKKYDVALHRERLEVILQNWDTILQIIEEEIPSAAELELLLDTLEAPKCLAHVGTDDSELPIIFKCTKDIRDKYVLSRLAWDLGIIEEII